MNSMILLFLLHMTMIDHGSAHRELLNTTNNDELVSALRVDGEELFCVKPDRFHTGSKLRIQNCSRSDERMQDWILEEVDGYGRFRSKYDDDLCMEAERMRDNAKVCLRHCDSNDDDQLWELEDGQIRPKRDSDYCMTYRGIELEVGDLIILKYCDTIENQHNADSKQWSFEGYDDGSNNATSPPSSLPPSSPSPATPTPSRIPSTAPPSTAPPSTAPPSTAVPSTKNDQLRVVDDNGNRNNRTAAWAVPVGIFVCALLLIGGAYAAKRRGTGGGKGPHQPSAIEGRPEQPIAEAV